MVFYGTVIRGLGLGKRLGLPPTMNLRLAPPAAKLRHGIYAARVETTYGKFGGVVHFGPRPAVRAPISFEVHCFGLKENMLRRRIKVKIIKRLRGIKNFRTAAALKKAILKDIALAKKILG